MKPFVLFLLVAAVGNATYHIGQKTLSPTVNPMALLMTVYAIAFLASAAAYPFFDRGPEPLRVSQLLTGPVLATSLGAFLIELGFLLAYRTGGSLQWSGAAVNGLAALTLVPIAVYLFRESLSLSKMAGIVLTVSGLALFARK